MGRSTEMSHKSTTKSSGRSRHRSPELHRRSHRSRSRSRSPNAHSRLTSRTGRWQGLDCNRRNANTKRPSDGQPKRMTPKRKKWNKRRKKEKIRKTLKRNFELSEHHVMSQVTEEHLEEILQNDEFLCDIPYDCTVSELKSEIALATGHATTLYIQRDGLSTLTVVLPQTNPTVANLRRGIEATARTLLQREQRQRNEDRMRRRNEQRASNNNNNNSNSNNQSSSKANQSEDDRQQVSGIPTKSQGHSRKAKKELQFRNAGELVYSEALSGQQHRENVSWRFLWRAYALLNVHTKIPLNDTNGRALLSEFGIENAATLKFCNRDKYFGKLRQR